MKRSAPPAAAAGKKRSISPEGPSWNKFAGAVCPPDIARIDATSVTPEAFFEAYVAKRLPVVIRGHFTEAQGWKAHTWSNARLRELAGEAVVQVEKRKDTADRFGRGHEISMKFGEFLECVDKGDPTTYMTTQDTVLDLEGRPLLTAPPVTQLLADVPIKCPLLPTLIPANLNVWMGGGGCPSAAAVAEGRASPTPIRSATGLHQDFHDNVYVVLRGSKHLQLFSPKDTHRMYTAGTVSQVHPNGLINYEGEETTAEGVTVPAQEAATLAQQLEEAQQALDEVADGDEEAAEAAEARVEELMMLILEAEGDDGGEDFSDDDEEEGVFFGEGAVAPPEPKADAGAGAAAATKAPTSEVGERAPRTKGDGKLPKNFSLVDLSQDDAAIAAKFPLFAGADRWSVVVEAGEMLYMPAGWFHYVTSAPPADGRPAFGTEADGGHMAFNYWAHPPSTASFSSPYESDFWQADWDARESPRT